MVNDAESSRRLGKVVVGSGWWCDVVPHAWALGSSVTRSLAFFDVWYGQVRRCLRPDRIVITDSASPIKPKLGSYECLQWIELDKNYGHANDIRTGIVETKYSGFTRSVINGAMYALCCDADFYIYIEQDCLVWGDNFLAEAIGESTDDILLGLPTQDGRGLDGSAAAAMVQQSVMIIRRAGLERFLVALLEAPWSDGDHSPEEIMRVRLAPHGFLRVPYGRSRPIDFGRSHFYAQHLDDDELTRFVLKLRPPGDAAENPGSSATPAEPTRIASLYDRVGTAEFWDRFFATPDPWGHSSPYEVTKRGHTISVIPGGLCRALELGCAEGHLTTLLADRVGSLVASDISEVALRRASERCHEKTNVVFRQIDLACDPLPGHFDLIVCSEILYYLGTVSRLRASVAKIIEALRPDGLLVLTHANLVSDDPDHTGFDWAEHRFGAKTIGEVVAHSAGMTLERELRTALYLVQRFRRTPPDALTVTPLVLNLPLTTTLDRKLERGIVWDGAIVTREAALRGEIATALPILAYHRVAEDGPEALAPYRISPAMFEQQIRWLRRHGYYSVSIEQWLGAIEQNAPLPGRPVLITFDDGYRDFFEAAWPILDRYGFSAIVFLVVDKVGGCAEWDAASGEPAPLMGWCEIRQLARDGVDFGSHGLNHRRLDALSTEQAREECALSHSILEGRLERRVAALSYPWGAHNEVLHRILAESGYRAGLTTRPTLSQLGDNPLMLPRLTVFGDSGPVDFAMLFEPPRRESPGCRE